MAEELLQISRECAQGGRWRGASLNAIHASIAAADAVCVLLLEERAAGESHGETAELLASSGAPDARAKAMQLSLVIELKSSVEYEARPPGRKDGEMLVKRAGRLVEWAGSVVRAVSEHASGGGH
jgi:hypothetical protein